MDIKEMYRYEEVHYHPGVDEQDNPLPGPGRTAVHLIIFKVLKKTPKGVWIGEETDKRFVLLGTTRQYASITKREALLSFIRRKYKHIEILESRKKAAQRALDIGKQMFRNEYKLEAKRYTEVISDQAVENYIFGDK